MLKVYLEPQGLHSRAMVRVARALERFAPTEVEITHDNNRADLIVFHFIDYPKCELKSVRDRHQQYAVIQYCYRTTGAEFHHWLPIWNGALVVWSYYNLYRGQNFYHAPLGIDPCFAMSLPSNVSRDIVITTGYVNGVSAEPIEECWSAINALNMNGMHVGPRNVQGMNQPANWESLEGVSDGRLVELYQRAKWVLALRHIEGFELLALEGLACGARPIVFDQPSMRRWYGEHAVYVDDCNGDELVSKLVAVMGMSNGLSHPFPVSEGERRHVIDKFQWAHICQGFWSKVMESLP